MSNAIRCLSPEPGTSFESFFINTLSDVGSMNLALALSSDPASLEMLEKIRRVTSGLLLLNAVFVESECLRFLSEEETEAFHRKWGLPMKWLSLETEQNGAWKADGQPCPPSLLKPLLQAHNITSLVSIHPRVFSWMNSSGEAVKGADRTAEPTMAAAV